MPADLSRRSVLGSLGAAAMGLSIKAANAPAAPVAIARCKSYQPSQLIPVLEGMFDKLGGLGRLVKGKTVAIKLNFNGGSTVRLGFLPLGDTHWPHADLLAAAMHLLARAGARTIRLVECAPIPWTTPFQEFFLEANWSVRDLVAAAPRVEFENTNYPGPSVWRVHPPGCDGRCTADRGQHRRHHRFVPGGPVGRHIRPAVYPAQLGQRDGLGGAFPVGTGAAEHLLVRNALAVGVRGPALHAGQVSDRRERVRLGANRAGAGIPVRPCSPRQDHDSA